jgi:anti-anti-sigma factor
MSDVTGFDIEESTDANGVVHVQLIGELDLAVVETLAARLQDLKAQQSVVQLDLSELSFMDSTGLGAVLTALLEARRDGWQLEVSPSLRGPVQRIIDIAGAGPYLWPEATV